MVLKNVDEYMLKLISTTCEPIFKHKIRTQTLSKTLEIKYLKSNIEWGLAGPKSNKERVNWQEKYCVGISNPI
jgi:hypothetical protein